MAPRLSARIFSSEVSPEAFLTVFSFTPFVSWASTTPWLRDSVFSPVTPGSFFEPAPPGSPLPSLTVVGKEYFGCYALVFTIFFLSDSPRVLSKDFFTPK